MANTDKFFTKPGKTQDEQTGTPKTYSKNEIKGVGVVRDASGKIDKKASYYTVSIRFPKEYEEPIKEIAWENKLTVTEYLNDLVQKELKKGKKI